MKFANSRKSPLLRGGLATAAATTVLLGAALTGFAATADAAPQSAQTHAAVSHATTGDAVATRTGWSFYRAYWTKSACVSEGKRGKAKGWWSGYSCNREQGNDGKMKWFLYVYNRVGG
ncbi:hypothetical protein ACIRPT_26420 [Streptomyces sp. NPDC101227]|uniref:hypothetical protein n=1 Tax=Streptomyces sp. NPDC101227 TaxID=3366136 RepID=UPI00382DE0C2